MTISLILLCSLLFIVAMLYASVGHGGASGYLALMALFSLPIEIMKPTSIVLNLLVSLLAFLHYYRAGHFSWKLFIPFAITSIPFSFLGGLLSIEPTVYKRILGILLLFPVIWFLIPARNKTENLKDRNTYVALVIGAVIGFLSGMLGIGGGIILSPILLLLHWSDQKQTAAVSSLFIFVNSFAGLMALLYKGLAFSSDMSVYIAFTLAGGWLGSYLGAFQFNQKVIKYILTIVLAMASCKLLFT